MIQNYDKTKHYDFYSAVSQSHKWPVLPPDLLPGTGFVSYQNDLPAAIVFIYNTVDTKFSWMEWLFCDYSFDKDQREAAISECIEAVKAYAKTNGLTIFTSSKGAKLVSRYANAGFVQTDTGMTNFIFRG